MPHSTRVLPPDPSLPFARAVAAANVSLGAAWTSWIAFGSARPVDPLSLAGAVVAVAAAAWCGLALRANGLPVSQRVAIVLAGASALAVWIPVPFIVVVCVIFGIHSFILFPLLVAPIPLLLWGAACTTWYLSKHAVASFFGSGLAEPESV